MAGGSQPLSLGEYLVREGIISQMQFNTALAEQRDSGLSLGRILVDMDVITESMRMTVLQKQFGFELQRVKAAEIDPIILTLVPRAFAEKHRAVPVSQEKDRTLIVAMEDPSDLLIVDAIKNQVGLRVKPVIASREDIQAVLARYQSGAPARPPRPSRPAWHDSGFYRFLKVAAFPILALAPLVAFFVCLILDVGGLQKTIQSYLTASGSSKFGTYWDLTLYFLLSWGAWTIILFEVNGLIFGERKPKDEDLDEAETA